MKTRIRIGRADAGKVPTASRRATLTHLAKIAQACGAIVLFGLSSDKSSAQVGRYVGNTECVIFDGSGRCK